MRSRPPGPSREIKRALAYVSLPSQALTGKARWNLVAPRKRGDYYISVGYTDKPYGRSDHTSAYLTHIVQGILLLWRNGKYVGCEVIWRCNARSTKFHLLDEPTSILCAACKIERNGPRPRRHE